MKIGSDVINTIIWSIMGIAGGILFAASFARRGKGAKSWQFLIGVPLLGISIYSLSTVNQGFASGLTLLATLGAVFMAMMSLK
jgi:hypothetical protein